jgi:pyruvate kinase
MTRPSHKTKIVATIGPASDAPDVLERMIRAGMNVARLNFSHGTFEQHAQRIETLRAASKVVGSDIALMADLPGPKMRIGQLATEPIELKAGDAFTLTTHDITGDTTRASVTFTKLPQVVKRGDMLFLNDGSIQLEVVEVSGAEVRCRVVAGGELRSRKGLNLPGIDLGIGAFTERDHECLQFALEHGVDAVSQSFVESAADIQSVRQAAAALGYQPLIIAKIERRGALDRVDEILAAADGLMIARGDLGVEVPIERIALLQKLLMRKAIQAAKPVITATQMLESMTHSRQPTRAEATDVANAVLDGTDCVMLSGESANGKFPVEAVETLARIAAATEPHRPRFDLWERLKTLPQEMEFTTADLLSLSVEAVMTCGQPVAVITPTHSGATPRSIARFRLPVWVVAATSSLAVIRRLHFTYGILPLVCESTTRDWRAFTRQWVRSEQLTGRLAILVQGPTPQKPEADHRMELIELTHE